MPYRKARRLRGTNNRSTWLGVEVAQPSVAGFPFTSLALTAGQFLACACLEGYHHRLSRRSQVSFAQFTCALAVPGTKRGKQSSFLLYSDSCSLRSRKGDAPQPGHARAHRIQLSSQQSVARRFSQDIVIVLK